jgi:biopolymer transport protein ExbD
MRRFSERSHLVTLSEINITPLLDLAFVLLIIFVITTPLLDQSINLKLPTGGQPDKRVEKGDIRTVEITPQGDYALNKRAMKLNQLIAQLVQDFKYNPNLVINVRADENSRMKDFVALTDACTKNGISRYSIRTEPPPSR